MNSKERRYTDTASDRRQREACFTTSSHYSVLQVFDLTAAKKEVWATAKVRPAYPAPYATFFAEPSRLVGFQLADMLAVQRQQSIASISVLLISHNLGALKTIIRSPPK